MSQAIIETLILTCPIKQDGEEPITKLDFHEITLGDIDSVTMDFDVKSILGITRASTGLPLVTLKKISPRDAGALTGVVSRIFGDGHGTTPESQQP